MKCPHCGSNNDRVIDSREAADGTEIRRRRYCGDCQGRWTTWEGASVPNMARLSKGLRKLVAGLKLHAKLAASALREVER